MFKSLAEFNSMNNEHGGVILRIFVLIVFINIGLFGFAYFYGRDQAHIRQVKETQAKVYLAKNPIFPSLANLSSFIHAHFGDDSQKAGQYIYRISVYGQVKCVQADWKYSFLSPGHYSYHIFSCSN